MQYDLQQIKEIIALCRKQGVSRLTLEGLSLELGPMTAPGPSRMPRKGLPQAKTSTKGIEEKSDLPVKDSSLTEEEILFWSASAPAALTEAD